MKFKSDQKFFVFDVESVGLHGQAFAVAGGVYGLDGKAVEGSEFLFSCGPEIAMHCKGDGAQAYKDREWVDANVTIQQGAVLAANPAEVRHRFWGLWELAKRGFPGILMFVECGWPVEARFLLECIDDDQVSRYWNGPYPLHEIATMMLAAGMDPMATYDRLPEELPAHDPLADARLSARLLSAAIGRLDEAGDISRIYDGPDLLGFYERSI